MCPAGFFFSFFSGSNFSHIFCDFKPFCRMGFFDIGSFFILKFGTFVLKLGVNNSYNTLEMRLMFMPITQKVSTLEQNLFCGGQTISLED